MKIQNCTITICHLVSQFEVLIQLVYSWHLQSSRVIRTQVDSSEVSEILGYER